jgi:peptide-methionine (S)-S-oxide reductase
MDTATLAGGCFWCTEAVFKRLKGVSGVVSGYTGGTTENPMYDDVCTGDTGHAEAIQISFDSRVLPYTKLLEIFFHLHDPTTANRQGNDNGTQYRSVIFYHGERQRQEAEKVKEKLDVARLYRNPIVTEILPVATFYPAEDIHQNYYEKNSYQPYCQYVIDPKLQKLLKEYKDEVKNEYQKM